MKVRTMMASAAVFVMTLPLSAGHGNKHKGDHKHNFSGVSISMQKDFDDDGPASCGDLMVTFDRQRAVPSQEQIQVPAAGTLQVDVQKHGGVHVQPGTGSAYTVRLCKAISPTAGASVTPSSIRMSLQGNRLSVTGPEPDGSWVGYLLIDAPRGASMNVRALNAPISFSQVDGNFTANATNGPISVKNSEGTFDAETKNGPITFAGNSGDVKLSAMNGPVSVKLNGTQWRGEGLVAETQNGPVSLKLPDDYRSGVRVSGSRGPWSCKGGGCSGVATIDDDFKTFTLGSGEPVVRISTVNGPVSITQK